MLVVEERALGVAVDHRPLEPELVHGAIELAHGRLRVRGRQRRKAREPVGMFGDRIGKAIVGVARHWDRNIGREPLRPRLAEREHLHVDPGRIHVAQPRLAEIGDLC